MRRRFALAGLFSILLVSARSAIGQDAFEVAKQQVEAFAPVLGAIRACDPDEGDEVYLSFMKAKRARGLEEQQTAFLGTYVGAMEGMLKPESPACSAADKAAREAEITRLRETW
jgi:hypothetical protein